MGGDTPPQAVNGSRCCPASVFLANHHVLLRWMREGIPSDTIRTLTALLDALEQSQSQPLILFKHSKTCPVSNRAIRQPNA